MYIKIHSCRSVVVVVVGTDRLSRKLNCDRELHWKIANFKKHWRKVCVWVHTYIHTYIHTHIHAYTLYLSRLE